MRTETHTFLARLPARKFITVAMLLVLVCGGVIAGSGAFS